MSPKRYAIIIVFSGVIIFGLPALTLYLWSTLIGEGSAKSVVEKQKLAPTSLYLSGIKDNNINYKLAIYSQRRSNVVALGSSRSMQVRASFFKESFTNFGGIANSIPELDYVATQIINLNKKPSIVLLFADVWWFNENWQNPRLKYTPSNQPDYLTFTNINLLVKPIHQNGIIFKKDNRLGYGAAYKNQGFDASGSFHYVATVTGDAPSNDFQFQDTLNRINSGTKRFEYSHHHSIDGANRFIQIIERLENENIHVVLIMPPFANTVYQKMMLSKNYAYIETLTKYLHKNLPVFDFTNPNNILGTNDCEFIDGFHGGETVYARLLLQVAASDEHLAKEINTGYLSKMLMRNKGISSPETIKIYGGGKSESDFLGLACNKQF
ncbi:MAG: hypothetical protein ACAH12_07835 [Methylophilaceae bacterium]